MDKYNKNTDKNLHISDFINRMEQLILFAQFVQNDYYSNGIEHAEFIVYRWLNRENNLNNKETAKLGIGSLLERAMLTLDDYLNAGCKEKRKKAAESAKFLYKEYYGVDYVNRSER